MTGLALLRCWATALARRMGAAVDLAGSPAGSSTQNFLLVGWRRVSGPDAQNQILDDSFFGAELHGTRGANGGGIARTNRLYNSVFQALIRGHRTELTAIRRRHETD